VPANQALYHLSHSISPFGSGYLFFAVLGLELRAFTLSHSTSPIFVISFYLR
jgi:hypothetical protein